MHQILMTGHQFHSVLNEEKSPSTVLEMDLESPSSPVRKGSSDSSPAEYALRSTSPFESEQNPGIISEELTQMNLPPRILFNHINLDSVPASPPLYQGRGEAFTLPRLSPISSSPSSSTASSGSSPTSEPASLVDCISGRSCDLFEATLDLSQVTFLTTLGKGSTASVFEVTHTSSELNESTHHLAMKVMNVGRHNDKHWLRERAVLELLGGEPSVVKLIAAFEMVYIPSPPKDAFFDEYTPVRALALEYCPRGELVSNILRALRSIPSPLTSSAHESHDSFCTESNHYFSHLNNLLLLLQSAMTTSTCDTNSLM